MDTQKAPLSDGYFTVPDGKLATIVTCLEMRAKPPVKADPPGTVLTLARWTDPDIEGYRTLFRAVGEDWMWMSRLVMDDAKLAGIITDPLVEIYVLSDGERRLGLLELDFRKDGECELAFFGVVGEAIGLGAGRFMMNRAIERAWSRPIARFWVHTCHLDHPKALPFYQRSGFLPYATLVEVADDPRLTGLLRADAAPHVPLILAAG